MSTRAALSIIAGHLHQQDPRYDPASGRMRQVGTFATRREAIEVPIPARHGGKLVVATCLDCHGLKDRRVKGEWPVDALVEAVAGCSTPLARIVMAGLLADWQDLRAENERLRVGTPDMRVA